MAHDKSTFNILLEIDGTDVADFSEVEGLTSDGDVIEYREREGEGALRKLEGLRKFGQITSSAAIPTATTFGSGGRR
jgi:hypothetical protein